MAVIDDIPGIVYSDAPEPRSLTRYQSFISDQLNLLATNASAYVNKRTYRKNKFSDSTLRKVFTGATFIPAHPTRYSPGDFRVENMRYFVVHRPGVDPAACTLLNVVREFAQENKPASTHFIIGFNGELIQMVDLQDVAYHCGHSVMPDGKKNGNYTAVGVELEGAVGQALTYAQYVTLAEIISRLNDINGFLPNKNFSDFILLSKGVLLSHEEIRPEVKTDPGANFNFKLLGSLIQKLPTTTRAQWYQPAVDALTSLGSALQEIYLQAANPGSRTEAALLNATTSTSLAIARQLSLLYSNQETTANWAANTANKRALSVGELLAVQAQQMARLSATLPSLPDTSVAPLLDFDTGQYTNEE